MKQQLGLEAKLYYTRNTDTDAMTPKPRGPRILQPASASVDEQSRGGVNATMRSARRRPPDDLSRCCRIESKRFVGKGKGKGKGKAIGQSC
ncbi:hypothetical protein HO173_006603 [Letharia columbiana]|uniref:Uncharacterized protein n=1 Tax=Letharia columbiana TaxID=112416 RepID=A0A8H6FV98_9LECA|nr:uncharacterized protein HO173_006603 [Letharia columbiana]KAF6235407.1 hypothetical protein HO173_006603 [Letharia columbiana]